ncbi:hypothetical protein AGMMS49938_17600 [Fibrobacterales bacterium]|nr:hypothetical protein AGMMS49938_17600 [Fibrobacterales bacterium]
MPYIAMARKWRPHSFEEMSGQEHIAQTLKNAITTGNIHHAFLFAGTRGVGKTTSARILAAMLNCTGGKEKIPCGECEHCQSIASGSSLDITEIDAASNNGVGDMREVLESTKYPPMNSKFRVLIIDEVHALSKAAWNSMLKTLEEPPPYLIFIFATTEVNKVLPTILSRVLRFDFKRLSPSQISKRLSYISEQENIKVAPEALSIIAEKADGSMRDALTIFDEVFAFSGAEISQESVQRALGIPPDDLYFELISSFDIHDAKGSFAVLDKSLAGGVEVAVFLEGFTKFLRNFLYAKLGLLAAQLEVSEENLSRLKATAPTLSQGDILRIAKNISELREKCSAKYGLNPRLLAEAEFSRLAWLDRAVDFREALKTSLEPKKNTATNTTAPNSNYNAPPSGGSSPAYGSADFSNSNTPASNGSTGSAPFRISL